MRSYDAPTQAARADPSIIERGMILFSFASGNYGFWDGDGPFTYGGVTYKSGAQIIEIATAAQTLELASNGFTLKLYANPDAGLTPNVLSSIESEDYHQKSVMIFKAIFDKDSRALISVTTTWGGVVDYIEHEGDDGNYAIVGHLESKSLDYSRRGTAMASNAQQQQISAGDVGFEYAGYGFDTLQIAFGSETPNNFVLTRKPQPVL